MKKKGVQLKKMGSPVKKTELKAKPVESSMKSNGSKKEEPAVAVVKKLEEIKPKVEAKSTPTPPELPLKPLKEEAPKVRKSSCDEAPKTRKSVSREDSVKTPEVTIKDPIKELREVLTESLKAQQNEPKEETIKKVEEPKAVEVRREDKPKVDVMQTLTEACRKLEQLKSKKKEAPVLEVTPRSPEGAAMTTEKILDMEKSLTNSVISPVNMQVISQILQKWVWALNYLKQILPEKVNFLTCLVRKL